MAFNFDEMLEDHGIEFLAEHDPDSEPMSMDEFNEFTNYSDDPLEAIRRAFYGGRYGHENDCFNPNDEWFAYNGYGNLISIPDYALSEYLKDRIYEEDFKQWCIDYNYYDPIWDDEESDGGSDD